MPYLKLKNARTGETLEFEEASVRVGRAPDLELILEGEGSEVVSGNHAVLAFREGAWVVEDTGSTNGTFVGDLRLEPGKPVALRQGTSLRFGAVGPHFTVDAVAAHKLAATVVEGQPAISLVDATVPMNAAELEAKTAPMDAAPPGGPTAHGAPPPPSFKLTLLDVRSGGRIEKEGARLRIGRGPECEIRPVQEGDTSVSRIHAEIVLKPDRAIILRDAGSRNGTTVNGNEVRAEHELREGDRIQLGNEGPELIVSRLVGGRPPPPPVAEPAAKQGAAPAAEKPKAPAPARRSFAGKGKTMFFRELIEGHWPEH